MMPAEERVRILREAKPDTWLAFSSDESRVVGRGSSYLEAVEQAEKHGEAEPVLVKTPSDWSVRVFLLCG